MKFNLSRFIEIVDRVGPSVLAVVPGGDKIAPLIPKIVHGIKEAQAIKGASGQEKKEHVLNALTDGADVAAAAGVKISSEEVTAIASRGIDTVIEAVHVVEGAKAAREDEAASTAAPTGGHATHGHGSADDPPPAPAAPANDPPPSDAFEGGAKRKK